MKSNVLEQMVDVNHSANAPNYEHTHLEIVPSDEQISFERVCMDKPYHMNGTLVGNYMTPNGRELVLAPPGHTLLVGSTGSGKTQSFFLPSIEIYARSEDKPSLLIMDLKGEMLAHKSAILKAQGYEVFVFNAQKPFLSSRYNPMQSIFKLHQEIVYAEVQRADAEYEQYTFKGKRYNSKRAYTNAVNLFLAEKKAELDQKVIELADRIAVIYDLNDQTWDIGAKTMIMAVIYGLLSSPNITLETFHLASVKNVLCSRQAELSYIFRWLKMLPPNSKAHDLLAYIESRSERTVDSFMAVVLNSLNRVLTASVEYLTSYGEIDIDCIAQSASNKPIALFVIPDPSDYSRQWAATTMLCQLINNLKRTRECESGDYKKVVVLWDEFCNSGRIEDVVAWVTSLRGYGISLVFGVQSFEQLDMLYGRAGRNTILGNTMLIFLGSNNQNTIQEVSFSFGKTLGHTVTHHVSQTEYGVSASQSVAPENVPLVKMCELAALRLGEGYVKYFGNGNHILKTQLQPDFLCLDFSHKMTNWADSATTTYKGVKTYDLMKVVIQSIRK